MCSLENLDGFCQGSLTDESITDNLRETQDMVEKKKAGLKNPALNI